MKAVVRTCVCAISLDHLDFRLFMFGSHSSLKSEWIHCQLYFELEVHLPYFRGSCLSLELVRMLLIIWIAIMVYWQYFIIFFISGSKFLSHNWRELLALAFFFFSWPFEFQIVRNWDEFTEIFILRRTFMFLIFEEAAWVWSLCECSWSFELQSWCTGSIL